MNAATCPNCGDEHLCPGRNRTPTSGTLTRQIAAYIADTFEANPAGIVSSQAAYEAYRHWCVAHHHVPYSVRRFVAAMQNQPGIRRVKRSTMRFAGISWRTDLPRGRHAAPEEEADLLLARAGLQLP